MLLSMHFVIMNPFILLKFTIQKRETPCESSTAEKSKGNFVVELYLFEVKLGGSYSVLTNIKDYFSEQNIGQEVKKFKAPNLKNYENSLGLLDILLLDEFIYFR